MNYSKLCLRDAVSHPDGKDTLLERTKEFVSGSDLSITREGDVFIVTGKTRSLEIPAGVVLFAVREGAVADNLGALAGKRGRK